MGSLIVGLDLGTTLCKAGAYELDGTLRASATTTIETYRPAPGWAEQDPLDWTAAIRGVLTDVAGQLKSDAQNVAAIGVSSHGPGLIPTDKHFRPLAFAPIWQDQRGADLLPELLDLLGSDWVGLGMPESSFVMKLYWALRHQPELIRKADHLFDVKGFVLATLTGKAVDESSSSPGGRGWNQSTFERLGVSLEKLPETVPSLSVVGSLLPELSRQVGLPANTIVVAGLNDGAAATLGAGVCKQGHGIVSLSTNGVMRTLVSGRVPGKILVDNSFFCYSYATECFVTGGTTKSGGDSVRWFIDTFLKGYPKEAVFDQIAQDAARSPLGAKGVIFMPYLMGAGSPHCNQEPQGAFLRLARHHERPDLTRALLEGVAFSLRDIGEAFNRLGWTWEALRFTGGGSKNPVWRQIVADVLGKPLTGVQADSVLGVAITAALGGDFLPSISEIIAQWVQPTFHVEPNPKNVCAYNDLYPVYQQAHALLDEFLYKGTS